MKKDLDSDFNLYYYYREQERSFNSEEKDMKERFHGIYEQDGRWHLYNEDCKESFQSEFEAAIHYDTLTRAFLPGRIEYLNFPEGEFLLSYPDGEIGSGPVIITKIK